eukprot:COSAG05_NODE_3112_length_2316_cov_5.407758_2_plen_165_part_00
MPNLRTKESTTPRKVKSPLLVSERARTAATHPCPRRGPVYRPSTPLRRPAAAASRRKLLGAAARHPTDHPEAHFRTPTYLPDRPDRLAPCRGHALGVTSLRPQPRYAGRGSRPDLDAELAILLARPGGWLAGRSGLRAAAPAGEAARIDRPQLQDIIGALTRNS